jgi:hypothetical protein
VQVGGEEQGHRPFRVGPAAAPREGHQ